MSRASGAGAPIAPGHALACYRTRDSRARPLRCRCTLRSTLATEEPQMSSTDVTSIHAAERRSRAARGHAHRVVIVGGGFGGLQAARGLRHAPVEITLIDRRNFHLFQPLTYQVATGAL